MARPLLLRDATAATARLDVSAGPRTAGAELVMSTRKQGGRHMYIGGGVIALIIIILLLILIF